ncbi:MAG: nucleotidyltransferase family protein [Pseudomonadota bacterium]
MNRSDIGKTIAACLAGSWREHVEPAQVSEEALELALPELISLGSVALAQRRVRLNEALAASSTGQKLADAARGLSMRAMMLDAAVPSLNQFLNDRGFQGLLMKGWAVAQAYHTPLTRPSGDMDLLVTPDQFADVFEALYANSAKLPRPEKINPKAELAVTLKWDHPGEVSKVDLHGDLEKFDLNPVSELIARSPDLSGGTGALRTPDHTDHLQILAVHMLIHGAWRPIWLVDIAAMVERHGSEIRWDRYHDPLIRNWIATSLHLAKDLLGADLSATPDWVQNHAQPRWAAPHVLDLWCLPVTHLNTRPTLKNTLRMMPAKLPKELMLRWPKPIAAIVQRGRPIQGEIRLNHQLLWIAGKAWKHRLVNW